MKIKHLSLLAALALCVPAIGCDADAERDIDAAVAPATTGEVYDSNEPVTDPGETDVDVNIDTDPQAPAETRIERRQERRENIRDAVDGVDVNVGNGGVDVDVE